MADEPIVKQTFMQKLLFYTTAFFILLATFSLFAFLFLVPFVIDPAFETIFKQFDETPAMCYTMQVSMHRGTTNCSWSSCREGCTRELFECTQILVNYKVNVDPNVPGSPSYKPPPPENLGSPPRKRRSLQDVAYGLAESYGSLFGLDFHERETRAIRDYDYPVDLLEGMKGKSLPKEKPTHGFGGNDSEWYYTGAQLRPNVKGCGYPPMLNCTMWLSTYRKIGTNYTCYFSRVEPNKVISDYDINQVYMNLVYAMAIPIPSFIVSVIYLVFAYFVIYAEDNVPRPRPAPSTGTTPVPPPTSGALTPASEVFREDLASFGHDFKVAMADEASRESVATCTEPVPNSDSVPDL
jgi:hypothetical protein